MLRTGIWAAVGEHIVANPVGKAGGSPARALGLAPFAQAADQSRFATLAPKPRHEPHDIYGVVLAVTIHGGNHRSGGGDHAVAQRCALAGARAVAKIAQRLAAAKHGLGLC